MALDYGLLGNLASGVREGLVAYQTKANMDRQNQFQNLVNGVQTDPTTGQLAYTPEKQALIDNQNKLQGMQTQQSLAEYDPNSDQSMAARNIAKGFLGDRGDVIPDTLSASQLKEQQGLLTTGLKGQDMKDSKDLMIQANQQKAQEAAAAKSERDQKTTDDKTEKRFGLMQDALDPNKQRAGNFAKIAAMQQSGERIKALLAQYPDGNIPAAQTHELAQAQAALVGGGNAQSQQQINSIVPSSLRGDAEGIASWFTNNPRGLQQQAYIKALSDSTDREMNLAGDQLKTIEAQRLGAFSDLYKKDPERYKMIANQMAGFDPEQDLDEKGQFKGLKNGKLVKNQTAPGGLLPGGQQGQSNTQYAPDVLSYAQAHGITPEQAQAIKAQRTGGQ